ncbi:HAD family hydrolase [Pseudothermotoga thermarum]|uniref:Haloacid dehalogenase domain protein hydrolase n=1 Tax=Pseudothermotoga thermarum DSM 5069 TaxID=688269 RepID=F7YWF0_9THEM|nr:HAD family hydrolase [Pseudothermotoga thermarum]AEH51928.1 Haloacid dehalogenase domain protein hydrolase [Pseudothermotoga thermarum DSM 5069]
MKAILFDYDGTLALVDEDQFAKAYFERLKNFVQKGYSVSISSKDVLDCVEHIISNANGKTNNFSRFLKCFSARFKVSIDWEKVFNDFYTSDEFENLKVFVKPNLNVIKVLLKAKESGLKTVLATNPVFPMVAIKRRLNWIDLDEKDFDLITAMENFHYCKPDPRYFLQICFLLNVEPKDCVMVGNDDYFDKACEKVGVTFKHVSEIEKLQF